MSYVGGTFLHDVFISYSRGDVGQTGQTKLSEWSKKFYLQLLEELRISCKEDVAIFFDESDNYLNSVDPMAPLSYQLKKDIGQSAVLVALMSDFYLRSGYCTHERESWFEAVKACDLGVPDRTALLRSFPVTEEWPKGFLDHQSNQLFGFYFYDREKDANEVRPFGWTDRTMAEFEEALISVAGRIKGKLDLVRSAVRKRERDRQEAARLAGSQGDRTIYLYGRASRAREWDAAAAVLSDGGFSVLPLAPESIAMDPKRLQESRELRVQTLVGCDALLLVAADNSELAADLAVVGKDDRNYARELSRKFLPCAVLDTGTSLAQRRDQIARSFGVGWITARTPWLPSMQEWLFNVSQQVGA